MSRYQFHQKFKLVVKASRFIIYFNTTSHTRALWVRSVNVACSTNLPHTWCWIFHFKWGWITLALISCQETNSTECLSWCMIEAPRIRSYLSWSKYYISILGKVSKVFNSNPSAYLIIQKKKNWRWFWSYFWTKFILVENRLGNLYR